MTDEIMLTFDENTWDNLYFSYIGIQKKYNFFFLIIGKSIREW